MQITKKAVRSVRPRRCLNALNFVHSTAVQRWFLPFVLQAYEDYLRHKADKEVNYKTCVVVRDGGLVEVYAKDIQVTSRGVFSLGVVPSLLHLALRQNLACVNRGLFAPSLPLVKIPRADLPQGHVRVPLHDTGGMNRAQPKPEQARVILTTEHGAGLTLAHRRCARALRGEPGAFVSSSLRSFLAQVGDIVKVTANEAIPCDMVMLASHDPDGECFITTANLDGETNLKVTLTPPPLRRGDVTGVAMTSLAITMTSRALR